MILTLIILTAACILAAFECTPKDGEIETARRWTRAKFSGKPEDFEKRPGMIPLSASKPFEKGPCREGGVGKDLGIGLRCAVPSRLLVRLPKPGRKFTSSLTVESPELGIDKFSISTGDKTLWKCDMSRQKRAALPVEIDLEGADEFVLEAGGPRGNDAGCWIGAEVTLEDGAVIKLLDLPIEGRPSPFDTDVPFSFVYGGRDSKDLLPGWNPQRDTKTLDENRTEHTVTFTDPDTGLIVRCVAVEFHDFPTVEWTLYFKNTGPKDTPVIENIKAIDTTFERSAQGEFVLHHNAGSPYGPRDFEPLETVLTPNEEKTIATSGGRSTNANLPYFNLAWAGAGVIMVIGWPGQWSADFTRDGANGIRLTAGQELTHFILHPGEEVRSPRIVLQFWEGDWIRAQNVWRRWLRAYNTPHPNGTEPGPKTAGCLWFQFYAGDNDAGKVVQATAADDLAFMNGYLDNGIRLDYWWIDAGWYVSSPELTWAQTGTWEVDEKRYPGGLRSVFDEARKKGLQSVVWFEPERVCPETWLYTEHPDWLLDIGKDTKLLNMAKPEVREWLTETVSAMIERDGIDVYRNDFNIDPLDYWRKNDAPDRQGITEIEYNTGLLSFWDGLLARFPDLLIDTCSSGTRRSDIEPLRRAVTYWRSDYIREPVSQQCQTYGISFWYTIYANGVMADDPYTFRSNIAPIATLSYDTTKKLDFRTIKKLTDQWDLVSKYTLGDFYPLTPWSMDEKEWIAWQFDCPETGEGMVQAFRRKESDYESARYPLRGLDPAAEYEVKDVDSPGSQTVMGSELMENGLPVVLTGRPTAAIITYRKK